ncbi:MAG: sialidase family protein [Fimbriimonadales bacterium]
MTPLLAFTASLLALAPSSQLSLKNIKLVEGGGGFSPCEPSIAISKTNTNNIVAGVILDRAFATTDGGKTWKATQIKSKFGVWGDPTIVSDASGGFYYFHLSNTGGDGWIDRIVCQKSTDGGLTWSDGAGFGHNPPADQDKQWATTHPTKNWIYATWTQFDKYASRDPKMHSNIMFSMSQDGGVTWGAAKAINDISGDCLDDDKTTEGAVPAVGPDGKIYVAWANQDVIWFDKSADNGKTWLPHDIPVARQFGGWNMTIPGIQRSNGMPVLMIDNSAKATKGNLYLVWGDQRNSVDDSDILFSRSTDGGNTWSAPMTVNQDKSGKHQFLPWMAVDSSTGYIYIVYYDRRNYTDLQTDVMIAYSIDGGKTFVERTLSESPFTPTQSVFFGDYNNISAHGGVIAPIWTRMDGGKTSVWTAVIRHSDLLKR